MGFGVQFCHLLILQQFRAKISKIYSYNAYTSTVGQLYCESPSFQYNVREVYNAFDQMESEGKS